MYEYEYELDVVWLQLVKTLLTKVLKGLLIDRDVPGTMVCSFV